MNEILLLFLPPLLAAVLAGASSGALGVLLAGLRLSFLAVFAAHAALAGAILGDLAGVPRIPAAFSGSLLGVLVLERILRTKRVDPEAASGLLFSLSLGFAFIGLSYAPGPKSESLSLLWGSLLFVTNNQVAVMAFAAAILFMALWFWERDWKLLLFDRDLFQVVRPKSRLLLILLVLACAVISVQLEAVGGLMIYGLLVNPPLAALVLARGFRQAWLLSTGIGVFCAIGGFLLAWGMDWPAGASMVVLSGLAAGAALFRRERGVVT
jgi:manganese/iron transport system permease protein